jgi:uncharacterized cupin superfamily protein
MTMPSEQTLAKTAAVDATSLPSVSSTGYPEPFRTMVAGRSRRRLGDAFGLKNFGVNLARLAPGAMSSMRHWHTRQDELVYMLEGEVVLVTDAGEQVMRPGMVVGFPAGRPDGHHLINRSTRDAVYLEIGDRMPGDSGAYPDIDMLFKEGPDGRAVYTRKDGTPY